MKRSREDNPDSVELWTEEADDGRRRLMSLFARSLDSLIDTCIGAI
jgi:hypothetical protein